jgi:hypothetical protein
MSCSGDTVKEQINQLKLHMRGYSLAFAVGDESMRDAAPDLATEYPHRASDVVMRLTATNPDAPTVGALAFVAPEVAIDAEYEALAREGLAEAALARLAAE